MSLLNEMLHDLTKQKSNQVRPSLTAALSKPENKKINRFVLGGIGFILILFIGMILKPKSEIKALQIVKKTPEQNLIPSRAIAVTPKKMTAASTSLEKVSSQREPLAQHTQQKAPIQARNLKPDNSIDIQDESSIASANNVVKPPSERWRDAQMTKALQAIKQDDIKNAKAILQDILVKEPSTINAREKLASIYLSYGDFANATKVLNVGLEYAPEDPTLITIKAKILIGQDKTKEAIKLLKGDHPSMVAHPDYYATLASALESKGRISEAGTYYKSLIKVDPYNGKYWLGYAVALEYDNKTDQAINAYKRASQNSPSELAVRDYAEDRLKTLQG